MLKTILVTALLVASVAALPTPKSWFSDWWYGTAEPVWNQLKVTFPGKDNLARSYNSLPRTVSEATAQNWREISNGDCKNGGRFNGLRYILQNDASLVLLFDVQGTISGLQMATLKSDVLSTNNTYKYDTVSMFQSEILEGNDVFITTAYFVAPETICGAGRPNSDLSITGTGTGLYYQNGATPSTLITVPMVRKDAITEGWSKNKCFVGMGYHNFYRSEDFQLTQCTEYRPAFLLYNGEIEGGLTGFGLTSTGHATSINQRFEYPPAAAIKLIVGDDVAQCLLDQANTIGMTTMHIFFNNDYQTLCIK